MTPEERARAVVMLWWVGPYNIHNWDQTLVDIEVHAIAAAIRAALEDAALACDAIADDKHAQYKGRPPHAPDNEHRADTFTEGESSGAELCANAVRAMKVK